jgi:hexosaminidase
LESIYIVAFFGVKSNLRFGKDCSVGITIEVEMEGTPRGFDVEHERYELEVSEDGQVVIKSKYQVGILRAMDTLAQLLDRKDGLSLPFLPISIKDQPRYPYRGLMIDVSREYYPVDTLKNVINGLRMTKINVLHLHLTDDDSIPIQFPSYPNMVKYTAFSEKEIYTADDLKDLVKYAKERGVKIIPEVDIPGHIRSLGNDPDLNHLLTCYNKNYKWQMQDGQYIVGGPPSAVINPIIDETYTFIAKLTKDLVEIFEEADFFHFGGDEVNASGCWLTDPDIKKFMDEHGMTKGTELFAYFNQRLRETIDDVFAETNQEKPIAHWTHDGGFDIKWDQGSYLQYWGKSEEIPDLVKAYPDHKHILSPNDVYYFDCGTGNKYGDQICDPYKTWAMIRIFEPTDYVEDESMILGGEGPLWSELATPYNIYNKIWPRLGVISDIYWGPKLKSPINWGDIVADLVHFRDYIQENGIPANKISSR